MKGNDTGGIFNWHPLLMTLAFPVLMTEALLAYRAPLASLDRHAPDPPPSQHWLSISVTLVGRTDSGGLEIWVALYTGKQVSELRLGRKEVCFPAILSFSNAGISKFPSPSQLLGAALSTFFHVGCANQPDALTSGVQSGSLYPRCPFQGEWLRRSAPKQMGHVFMRRAGGPSGHSRSWFTPRSTPRRCCQWSSESWWPGKATHSSFRPRRLICIAPIRTWAFSPSPSS